MFKDRKFWIGLLVSAVVIVAGLTLLDWVAVGRALRQADYRWLALALPFYLVGYWSRAHRVSQILRPIKHVPTARCLPPLVIGFMFNNILPGRLGEFVLAYLLGRRENISRTAALAVVVISRILDGFTILAFLLFGMLAFLSLGQGSEAAVVDIMGTDFTRAELIGKVYLAGIGGAVVFALVFFGCFCLIVWKDLTLSLVRRLLNFFPEKLSRFGEQTLEKFIGGLDILKDPRALLGVFFFNFVPWTLELFTYYFTARAFGLGLNLRESSLTMGMTNLAMIPPSLPGGIGLFEGGGLGVMALFGINIATGFAFIVVVHAIILLPINVWGWYYLWKEGITFSEALQKKPHGR